MLWAIRQRRPERCNTFYMFLSFLFRIVNIMDMDNIPLLDDMSHDMIESSNGKLEEDVDLKNMVLFHGKVRIREV